MRAPWQKVIDSVLRPARPGLERCLVEREKHLAAQRARAEEKTRAVKDCVRRIELARAAVFAANDGLVPVAMTSLEREWRILSRPDPDLGLMDLWARIAPPSWSDRKRFRDSPSAVRLDAAIALAADVAGVEAAEAAVGALCAPSLRTRVRFRLAEQDSEHCAAVLARPLDAALEALARRGDRAVVVERARRFEREVHEAALARLPARPLLASDLAHAAFVDHLFRAAALTQPSPVQPLIALWSTGYVLAAIDASAVTLEIPPL